MNEAQQSLADDPRSLSEQAYDRIRRDILLGNLMPDAKLQIETVSDRYGIGAVPVREALNRLSAEGLVQRRNQRGFFVSPLVIEELAELVRTRILLETLALRESIALGDEQWEEDLVLACHRLARSSRRLGPEVATRISEEWDIRHNEFHRLLISCCASAWLKGFCATMMVQAVRYRNISLNINPNPARRDGAVAEHQALLEAALARDADLACRLLGEHYSATLATLRPAGMQA
ncbi:GntR family transcriptional regulator [Paracoccus zhejiangensis]|uniref:GntR family transcriptional regulator n=1 Tax=Paracoccus zhejiangensis TaxID=1077935 RepID=A0A2H5EVP5_9RHOB|nr:GntR family transcriptional regulator [Paracoccus zhejiangensis]AUH63357.1 GntR family transcriptional regulator [Paracoccus zhejiangensis]